MKKMMIMIASACICKDISKSDKDQLLIIMADAHSPKNQFLVEGLQQELDPNFPITGGSANKNVGQTFVYYEGKACQDAAVALMLSGDFKVALAGRQAKDNDAVISSAGEAAAEAKEKLGCEPIAALAFNCGGRKGKLDRLEDELSAIQDATGKQLPCSGAIAPVKSVLPILPKRKPMSSAAAWAGTLCSLSWDDSLPIICL